MVSIVILKKILFFFSLYFVLIPFNVYAIDDISCENVSTNNRKTVEIRVQQEIINKDELSEHDKNKATFNYKILDLDDNVLDETTNDEDGNVIFHCFTVNSSDVGNYKLYKIVMDNNENIPFDSDNSIIYFSLRPNYTNGLFDPLVAFYKDDGDDSPERYGASYKGEVFHATEEELQGQAYAVLDKDTGVLTFFRDEENKYINKQEIGSKIYYTGNSFTNPWSGGWDYSEESKYIKEIIFEDAVKPNSVTGWFENLPALEKVNIEKLDTSLLTKLDYFFYHCPNLKHVDISTLDVKNINSLSKSFADSGVEYLDFSVLNLDQNLARLQISELLNSVPNLKYLNISNFGNWSSSAEFHNLTCLEKIVIGNDYDFYRSSFGYTNDIWYSTEKNRAFTAREIKDNLYHHTESMAGYYIRPMCTTEASFISTYNPNKIKSSISIDEVDETEELNVEIEDLENVEYQKKVKFRVKAIKGYEVEKIIITDMNDNVIDYVELDSNNEYEFTMPDTNVTIKPVYKKMQSINVPNTLKNFDIGTEFLIIILITIASICIKVFFVKKKEFK